MDLNDARLYFEDPEDFESEYEDLFFEAKQFFYTRSVIPTVFKARLDKLKKHYEAYCALSGEDKPYSEKRYLGSEKFNKTEKIDNLIFFSLKYIMISLFMKSNPFFVKFWL